MIDENSTRFTVPILQALSLVDDEELVKWALDGNIISFWWGFCPWAKTPYLRRPFWTVVGSDFNPQTGRSAGAALRQAFRAQKKGFD